MNTERTSIKAAFPSKGRGVVLALLLLALGLAGSARAEVLTLVLATNLFEPYGLAVSENNRIYVADSANNRVVRYNQASGLVEVIAGRSGDNKGAVDATGNLARFYGPQGMVISRGVLVVADTGNNLIRTVTTNGVVTTVAGNLGLAVLSHDLGFEPDNYGAEDAPTGVVSEGRLHSPSGLAVDSAGIVYIADSLNGSIRRLDLQTKALTTVSSAFVNPTAVAVGASNLLFVADAATHSIYRLDLSADGARKSLLAGGNSPFAAGYKDSGNPLLALFNSPRGLLFTSAGDLLVADTGNAVIRRIVDADTGGSSVTSIPVVSANVALISPVALVYDKEDVLLIADRADNSLKGFLPPASNLKQVETPLIGTVEFPLNGCGATLTPLVTGTFINDPLLAMRTETGSATYFEYGDTLNAEDVPDPTLNSLSPPPYSECQGSAPRNLLNSIPIRSGTLLIKAFSTQISRRSSAVAIAKYTFRCANPVVNGSNPVGFGLSTDTREAEMWYTFGPTGTNIPEPTNAAPSHLYTPNTVLNIFTGVDVTIRVRAFRKGYLQSAITEKSFVVADAKINTLGLTRDFTGAPGALLAVPIELQPAPSNVVRSLQFKIEVVPVPGQPGSTPVVGTLPVTSTDFILVNPAGFDTPAGIYYSNGITNGIGLAYLSTAPGSQGAESNSVVTMVSLRIPKNAKDGDRYTLSVGLVSATSDGVNTDVAITNLPARRLIISTNLSYLVGDSASATWYNTGEFGDGVLKNDDVNGVFLATLGYRAPYRGTDAFDAMDAWPPDSVAKAGGDSELRYLDFQTIWLRSLQLDAVNWLRQRGPDGRIFARRVGGPGPSPLSAPSRVSAKSAAYTRVWSRPARIEARTLSVAQSIFAYVPVYAVLQPGTKVAGLQFVSEVVAPAGSPSIADLSFVPALGVPNPARSGSQQPGSFYVSWNLGDFAPSLSGSTLLGSLRFRVPAAAQTGAGYLVRFHHADGAADLSAQIDWETLPAHVWVNSPPLAAENSLPPEWREFFFGPLLADSILPAGDNDGDGASNYSEYLAGTNPAENDLNLSVSTVNGSTLVTWFGHQSVRYVLQTAASPTGPWVEANASAAGSNDWMTATRPGIPGASSEFFRLSAIPQN